MLSPSVLRRAQEIPPLVGRSLRELLVRGERPDRVTLFDWGCQLLSLLEDAHRRGALHGHLDEDAVIVTEGGRLLLTGFGRPRLACGPLLALPPEQLAGRPFTAQSDLYALGSLLRRLAFAGALGGGRGSLGARDPLLKVLARATFANPAGRYKSAAEMAEALREAARSGRPAAFGKRRGQVQSAASTARVAQFPGTAPRQLSAPSSPLSPMAGPVDGWRALLLLMVSLLLMTLLLTTGWLLSDQRVSTWPGGEPLARTWAPIASPPPAVPGP